MDRWMPLNALKPGQSGQVGAVVIKEAMGRRLRDLGFVDGTKVECVLQSPAGDPSAYLVRGAVIALRQRDAAGVMVWA